MDVLKSTPVGFGHQHSVVQLLGQVVGHVTRYFHQTLITCSHCQELLPDSVLQ